MATAIASHIWLDEAGVAWIDDTRIKVIEVAVSKLANGWSPEEMHLHYPHLSLAQIYAAIAYYYDHQVKYDEQIAADLAEADRLRAESMNSPFRQKLQAMGIRP